MTAESAAYDRIKRIQNGSGVRRDYFSDEMKGTIAKRNWDDEMFAYGMEYGYLLAMIDMINGTDATE